MKKLFFIFISLINILFLSITANAQTNTLIFATEATYPPYEYLDNTGKIQGFDIDIANAICDHLKMQCKIINQAFDSLIPGLQLGKFDAIIAAMNITPERKKQVDFTDSYYKNPALIVAPRNKKLSMDANALKNKTIGVQSGTTFGPYLQSKYGNNIQVKTYDSEEAAFLDLKTGRLDAVMGDEPLVILWLKNNNKDYEVIGQPVDDQNYFGEGLGIAVKKGNTALLQKLNQAIAKIKADGTFQKILDKNFGANR